MKEIQLTQGKVALVDDEDFYSLLTHRWQAIQDGENWYAQRMVYCKNTRKYIGESMARRIMNLSKGNRKIIDHKDRNGLNNQKSNLRICSHRENMRNRRSSKKSSSSYLGVSKKINKRPKNPYIRWVAQASGVFLGEFKTEQEAALAYNNYAKENYGQFANINIIK